MITVHFHGLLTKYGEKFQIAAATPAEAVKALCLQIPRLEQTIKRGNWHVLRGALEEQNDDNEQSLTLPFGNVTEMHLVPAVEGSGSGGGWLAVITGVVLIAAGVFTFGTTTKVGLALVAAGVGMAVGGIVMMTTKMPGGDMNQESVDSKASFILGRPTNSTKQGVPVPRGYGRFRVGSVQVSLSLVAEQLSTEQPTKPRSALVEAAMKGLVAGV